MGLRAGPRDRYVSAQAAIRAEHHQHNQWTTLRCRSTAHARGTLWRLTAPDLSSVSWAWEGATALCPIDPMHFDAEDPDTLRWRGVVVSADDATATVFIDISHCAGETPDAGTFLVKPYAFLESLHRLYVDPLFSDLAEPLASALQASAGEDAGTTLAPTGELRIAQATSQSWGILWGPPGTGKTWTIGQHVAALWPDRRILVISTTNRATDGVALSIARAIRTLRPGEVLRDRLVRVGSGADLDRFVPDRLTGVLAGGEVGLRRQLVTLRQKRARERDPQQRAALSSKLQQVRRSLEGCSREVFLAEGCRVVVTTAFNALRQLTDPDLLALAEAGRAPFDIVIIDEAGLVCRAAAAALSLLAAEQLLLVGDPRQLAPISKMSRLLPPDQALWLSESALSHLDDAEVPGVCMLHVQHRMHPEIRHVVSSYQYDGLLEDAPGVISSEECAAGMPRAGWFVLEDSAVLWETRAERGPQGKSWVRPCTPHILAQLIEAHPALSGSTVLLVTPFAAQARALASWIQATELSGWQASTVHSQQGAEADVVIFDTVCGGLAAWPPGEWQRLVNVGLSRARCHVMLLATRDEMSAPWLAPLQDLLSPCALRPGYGAPRWTMLPIVEAVALPGRPAMASDGLGAQLAAAKAARPVLSADQERLVALPLDGGPRLVRGIAGSGKTLVLACWLARALVEAPDLQPLWVVYGNSSLQRPLADRILAAWQLHCPGRALPWRRVRLWHVRELLRALLPERGLSLADDDFDYDPLCRAWLSRRDRSSRNRTPQPRCAMLFIDEAQDFGPETLKLLSLLATPPDPSQPSRRPVMIFYDHDQNLYRRPSPRWSALGLEVEGRTALLEEGFRSTEPITTAALNTLYQLQSPTGSPAYRQLLRRGLVQQTMRSGHRWWEVRFSSIDGPLPELRLYRERDEELLAVAAQIMSWVEEGVLPGDIRVLCGAPELRASLLELVAPSLESVGFSAVHRTGRALPEDARTLLITTPHSFKGHDAELVVIIGVDRFSTRLGPLASALYVAMTRARSMLLLTGLAVPESEGGRAVVAALRRTMAGLREPPPVALPVVEAEPPQRALLRVAGRQHLSWLANLWARHPLRWEPLCDEAGAPLAAPLFWLAREDGRRVACFSAAPEEELVVKLGAVGVDVVLLGEELPALQG
jgi:superfamily I DNA/RNA helicase